MNRNIDLIIEETKGKINPDLNLKTSELLDIASTETDITRKLYNCFVFGYAQGLKANEKNLTAAILSALERIEKRLDKLNGSGEQQGDISEQNTGDIFLQAIKTAIASGEYHISNKRYKSAAESSSIEIGRTEFDNVYILALSAYDIYCKATDNPLKRRELWAILEENGVIEPRNKYPLERSVGEYKHRRNVIYIKSDKLF